MHRRWKLDYGGGSDADWVANAYKLGDCDGDDGHRLFSAACFAGIFWQFIRERCLERDLLRFNDYAGFFAEHGCDASGDRACSKSTCAVDGYEGKRLHVDCDADDNLQLNHLLE